MSIELEIKTILAYHNNAGLNIEKMTGATSVDADLSFDSIDLVEVVMVIEDTFGIEIHDEEIKTLNTIQDFVNLVNIRK